MYKEELIHLHQLFTYLMGFLVDNGVSESFFEDYKELGISPHHIHKTKAEHKYAVLLLSSGISSVLAENNEIAPKRVSKRLGDMAKRCKAEMEG